MFPLNSFSRNHPSQRLQTVDLVSDYIFDPHTSILQNKRSGRRMLFLGADLWAALQDGLFKKFSSGASVIIQEMGNQVGEKLFDSFPRRDDSKSEASSAQIIGHIMFNSGCGKYKISGDMQNGATLSFVIRNCAFCESKNAPEQKCNFVRGIALGFSTKLYGKGTNLRSAA